MRILKSTNIKGLAHIVDQSAYPIEVTQGDWRVDNVGLTTWGVDSCLVLAAHNAASSEGLLGHFSSVSQSPYAVLELKNEHFDSYEYEEAPNAIKELGRPSQTSIWLGGCAIRAVSNHYVQLGILQDRLYGRHKLNKLSEQFGYRYAAIYNEWNTSDHSLGVELNCRLGELTIHLVHEE